MTPPVTARSSPISLYVHVPFCVSRCRYCDFASEVRDEGRVARYRAALSREIELTACAGRRLETIYIGGGTPTCIGATALLGLMDEIASAFDASALREWTIEANPGTVERGMLGEMRARGADRISLGAQSFDDALLELLGRIHTAAEAERALRDARDAGFRNVSLDLIYGLPGQTLEGVRDDAARAVDLAPEHVSVYGLTYEEGTELTRRRDAGELAPAGEELERSMYEALMTDLPAAGYEQYEIASFATDGLYSRHNTAYWTGREYLGLGPAAASYLGGARRTNVRSLDDYVRMVSDGVLPVAESESLDPAASAREALVLALRLRRGVDPGRFESRTEYGLAELLGEEGRGLVDRGHLEWVDGRLRIARASLPVADAILAKLV